ncbi:MAG: hypothetical protein COC24_018110 [Alphaproteobacteria bacterium]|nr:hypothetical protein [Alphaproteobacteria bacterium]
MGDKQCLEIKIDKEKAAFEMGSVQAEMQAYADENPIKQAVVFEWGAGDVDFSSSAASQSLNAATAAGNSNQLQPMTFNFPDGSVVKNVYADPSGVNQIESYIAREAAKRGSR